MLSSEDPWSEVPRHFLSLPSDPRRPEYHIRQFRPVEARPTLFFAPSITGFGSYLQGTSTYAASYAASVAAQRRSIEKEASTGATTPEQEEEQQQYPQSWKLGVILIALCLAIFCMALDNTIIATAIPKITDQFHAIDDIAWYGSAYLLTTCAFQLFFGRLYTFFSIKMVYLCAVGLFELGSLLCGVAPTSQALIVGRAIAGVGSAGIFSGSILIIAHSVPLRKRPLYTGFVGSMYGIASVAGPLLGGVFTDQLTWRWCFYINLPFGAVTMGFIIFCFSNPSRGIGSTLTWREILIRLDLPGTALFVPGVICLLLALQWGGTSYPWNSWRIILLIIMCVLASTLFVVVQWWQQENATVPPRIFMRRSVASAAAFAFCFGGAFFILIYYMPIWFQGVKGVSAVRSGIDTLPLVLAVALFSVISGVGITVLGQYKPWMVASSIVIAIGCGLLTTLKQDSGLPQWLGYQILAGAGFGLSIQAPLIVVQAILPFADVATATATMMFAQILGGALFVSVAQNVFINELVKNIHETIPGFPVATLLKGGSTIPIGSISGPLLTTVLAAYNKALNETFYVATAMAALSIIGATLVESKSVKGMISMGAA